MGMHMRCACPRHMSQASVAVDKDTHSMDSLPSCLAFSFFFFFFINLLVYEGALWSSSWPFALPPSGAPAASSTIVAVSGLAIARAHSHSGRSSSSGIIDSTPPSSAAESFSRDDLLALVQDKFTWLMQQQTIPPLSVQLAPTG